MSGNNLIWKKKIKTWQQKEISKCTKNKKKYNSVTARNEPSKQRLIYCIDIVHRRSQILFTDPMNDLNFTVHVNRILGNKYIYQTWLCGLRKNLFVFVVNKKLLPTPHNLMYFHEIIMPPFQRNTLIFYVSSFLKGRWETCVLA